MDKYTPRRATVFTVVVSAGLGLKGFWELIPLVVGIVVLIAVLEFSRNVTEIETEGENLVPTDLIPDKDLRDV